MTSISSLTSSGINGGLDVQSIVDNLITAEQQPVQRLQTQTNTFEKKISAYQTLNTRLLALKTSAENILFNQEDVLMSIPTAFSDRLSNSLFALRAAKSSDDTVVTVSAGKGAVTGYYTVEVSRLARSNAYASNNFASDTATDTKTGTITIQHGADTPVDIAITSGNNTLQGIKSAINSQNAGFTASILNDGSGTPYRLVVTANDSGAANNLTITTNWDAGSSGSDVTFVETAHGEDAALKINGVDIASSSNTVSNVIEGVTFNLKAATGTATVSIERDADAITLGIKGFVDKYNEAVSFISAQSTYDAKNKTAGILAGDFVLRDAQTKLSAALSGSVNFSSGSLSVLSQVGLKLMSDGTLSFDETRFREKLSTNYNETAQLFLANGLSSQGDTTSIIPMMLQQLKTLTDSVDGPIFHAKDAAQKSIDSINKQIDQMNLRLEARRAMYTAQFTKANEALAWLSVLQTSITNQLAALKES